MHAECTAPPCRGQRCSGERSCWSEQMGRRRAVCRPLGCPSSRHSPRTAPKASALSPAFCTRRDMSTNFIPVNHYYQHCHHHHHYHHTLLASTTHFCISDCTEPKLPLAELSNLGSTSSRMIFLAFSVKARMSRYTGAARRVDGKHTCESQ